MTGTDLEADRQRLGTEGAADPSVSGPSPHLSWAELACKDPARTPYPLEWRISRAVPLAVEFEAIRQAVSDHIGTPTPIRVNSAFRTLSWNEAVGGSAKSQHPKGRALDLGIPAGLTRQKFVDIIREVRARDGSKLRGIGEYPTFVHIDTRPTTRFVGWRGGRLSAEMVRPA